MRWGAWRFESDRYSRRALIELDTQGAGTMAKAPPAFQFYPADFMAGTAHLDAEAIGCYLLLLCFQWMHGFVPSDASQRARICRKSTTEFAPLWELICDKFALSDDGHLRNDRLEVVRGNQLAISEKRREAGRMGGKANAKQTVKQKGTKGRLKVEDRRLKYSTKEMESAFAAWWELVPNKIARADARKRYEQAVDRLIERGDTADPIAFLADRMAAFAKSDKGRGLFCPHPSTWLNKGQFDDDPEAWRDRKPQSGKMAPADAGAAYLEKRRQTVVST